MDDVAGQAALRRNLQRQTIGALSRDHATCGLQLTARLAMRLHHEAPQSRRAKIDIQQLMQVRCEDALSEQSLYHVGKSEIHLQYQDISTKQGATLLNCIP